jgi:hypothetical protein
MKFHPSMVYGHGCAVTWKPLSATNLHCGTVAASADVLADERLQVPSMGLGFGTVPCGK